jgi:hypothetical protein
VGEVFPSPNITVSIIERSKQCYIERDITNFDQTFSEVCKSFFTKGAEKWSFKKRDVCFQNSSLIILKSILQNSRHIAFETEKRGFTFRPSRV